METVHLLIFQTLALLSLFPQYESQVLSQWMDSFQRDLCRQRWNQMDWQSLIRPCRNNLEVGKNVWDEKLRTSPKWSHILQMDIKKTGEFSKIAIQSRTNEGRIKDIGGDTWRVYIRGPEFLTPYVTDLDNGAYQANFLITKPGFYKAEVILESTLCEGYKDPPKDWLDLDPVRWQNKINNKIWQPLRGGLVAFKVEPSDEIHLKEVKRNLDRFKSQCGKQYQCDLLWKGFGRWVNGTWHSYLEESEDEADQADAGCKRDKIGTLKVHGDCFTKHFVDRKKNSTLCKKTFKKCDRTRDWLYPGSTGCVRGVSNITSPPELNARDMSLKRALKYLKNVLLRHEMDDKSALLLNYGAQFIKSLTFAAYKKLINRVVRSLKRYKGQAVYRTTPFTWKPKQNLGEAFDNYQRTMLFNAYATSAMCQAGIPVADVFQQSVANPKQEDRGMEDVQLHTLLDTLLADYFKGRAAKGCEPTKKSFIEKIKELQPDKKSEVQQGNNTQPSVVQNQTAANITANETNALNAAAPIQTSANSSDSQGVNSTSSLNSQQPAGVQQAQQGQVAQLKPEADQGSKEGQGPPSAATKDGTNGAAVKPSQS